jgi:alkanesulfonate monooxygenase SsuD/methylene tetrahydromethanopterin reductase-like flavin-dependent oxidoreductase (luciferase family)
MRFAIEFAGAGATAYAGVLADLAMIAEDSGWEGVFLEDYIVHHKRPDMPTCDPWIALAAMAGKTRSVTLGTEVTPLPRRRPWKLAREVATLDHLSGGRMVLGVGLGDVNDPGFAGTGESTETSLRSQLVDESLAVIDQLWKGGPVSFSGRHFHVEGLTFLPRPLQKPRVPIWIGGGWPNPGVIRRALRWDGICAYIETGSFEKWEDHSPIFVRQVKEMVERARGTSEGFDIVTGGRQRADDWEADRAIISALAEAGATWWVEYVDADLDLDDQRRAARRGPLRPR